MPWRLARCCTLAESAKHSWVSHDGANRPSPFFVDPGSSVTSLTVTSTRRHSKASTSDTLQAVAQANSPPALRAQAVISS